MTTIKGNRVTFYVSVPKDKPVRYFICGYCGMKAKAEGIGFGRNIPQGRQAMTECKCVYGDGKEAYAPACREHQIKEWVSLEQKTKQRTIRALRAYLIKDKKRLNASIYAEILMYINNLDVKFLQESLKP